NVRGLYSQDGFNDAYRASPNVTVPQNVDIEAIRRSLASAASDASALYNRLLELERRVPGARQFAGTVLQLQAQADYLKRRITSRQTLEQEVGELQRLDAQWRELSYRMTQSSGRDRATLDLIRRMDATGNQISE